ncbi:hypothetical protein ACFL7M_06360 [Thermodesulfobacteriota bacterium]
MAPSPRHWLYPTAWKPYGLEAEPEAREVKCPEPRLAPSKACSLPPGRWLTLDKPGSTIVAHTSNTFMVPRAIPKSIVVIIDMKIRWWIWVSRNRLTCS